MWPRKRAPVSDDTGEAKIIRQSAERDLEQLRSQSAEVDSMVRKLQRRRYQNHFGEELSVTFRRHRGEST